MDKRVVIIGCGPGAADMITLRGKNAVEEADVVVGSRRLLSTFVKKKRIKTIPLENNYRGALEEAGKVKEDKKVAFLVSGDPMFYSFGESIVKRFGRENCEIIPGVSSFQYAFCRLKESWKDYKVFSLHGGHDALHGVGGAPTPLGVGQDVDRIFKENDRFIILLDPEHNLKFIKRNIKPVSAHGCTFYVASNLSMPGENILNISFDDFDSLKEESLSVLIVRRDRA